MRVLYLDDQPELLDTYRLIDNPDVLDPPQQQKTPDLFAQQSETPANDDFTNIRDIALKNSFFSTAADTLEAFEEAANSSDKYRIAVLDMQLPESSGLEVAEKLLAIDPEINIIFITAYSDWSIHDIGQRLRAGRTQFMFIKKPFELQEVIQALIYMHEKIQRSEWHHEALRNLLNFTRRYKVDSLKMFDSLLELKTFEMMRSIGSKRIPEMIQKNEKVLDLVEIILAEHHDAPNESFGLGTLLADLGENERVKIRVDSEGLEESRLLGNQKMIAFALRCLIMNALEYSSDGVTLSVRQNEENLAEFLVEDIGIGIPVAHHNDVFEPGYSLNPEAEKAGYGLALVQKILSRIHRAPIGMRSVPGKGTAVRFRLPIVS